MQSMDSVGDYAYEYGYCVRDAFRQALGDKHPIISECVKAITLGGVIDLCAKHGFTCLHDGQAITIEDGCAVIWIFSGDPQHAIFSREPQRIIDSAKDIAAVIFL